MVEGSFEFLAGVLVLAVGAVIALYTRTGSGMDHHPYRRIGGCVPGADLPCEDYSGAERTSVIEQEVARCWHRARDVQDPDAIAAQFADARKRRRATQQRPPSRRLPIRAPIATLL
jgi:hypothetical protein